jgi:NADPH:quinone reductase
LLVSFGNASGPIKDFQLGLLAAKGSLYVTRPTLYSYIASDKEFKETADDLINIVKSGKVKISVNQNYALADVAQAHRDLESGKTTGSTIITV